MNIDKRYCQNRVRKRKRRVETITKENEDRDLEEEREFKLRRFVQDVHKFVEGNDRVERPVTGCSRTPPLATNKIVKKLKPAKPPVKRGLFQNGLQTRFYSRGMMGKEMTARLDENLQQIIALANNEEDKCLCPHHCRKSTFPTNDLILARPPLQTLTSRSVSPTTRWKSPEPLPSTSTNSNKELAVNNSRVSAAEVESPSDLYSEFVRNITISSLKSKSIQFKSKSYASAVKKKLLAIYLKGRKENSQETDEHKISVGTSPMSDPRTDSDHTFNEINFVPERTNSTQHFLEEIIGPASSCHMSLSPDLQQCCQPSPPYRQCCQPSPPHRQGCQQSPPSWLAEPNRPMYFHEPMPSFFSTASPQFRLGSMVFDGGGDNSHFNPFNSFLPPIEEDSPVFQYFPRRMF
uniref:Uncharacterized protein n=1 Tax=Graphocephala atropunctata TaxID=36148 RepID=A0A1B6L7F8_9HEMI